MVHGFDIVMTIQEETSQIINIMLPSTTILLIIYIDLFSLYECLVKLGTISEKRLMIDLASLRQVYKRRQITEIK
jgi:hypothetical protein